LTSSKKLRNIVINNNQVFDVLISVGINFDIQLDGTVSNTSPTLVKIPFMKPVLLRRNQNTQ
jgi:hypothetical protein